MKEGATVVQFKADGTYDTLKKGTSRLVCYDRSGFPQQQPFSIECTSVANLDRAAQNLKFEAAGDKAEAVRWRAILTPKPAPKEPVDKR